jgi:hypothetical protein
MVTEDFSVHISRSDKLLAMWKEFNIFLKGFGEFAETNI